MFKLAAAGWLYFRLLNPFQLISYCASRMTGNNLKRCFLVVRFLAVGLKNLLPTTTTGWKPTRVRRTGIIEAQF
jgi:hypothetical protein